MENRFDGLREDSVDIVAKKIRLLSLDEEFKLHFEHEENIIFLEFSCSTGMSFVDFLNPILRFAICERGKELGAGLEISFKKSAYRVIIISFKEDDDPPPPDYKGGNQRSDTEVVSNNQASNDGFRKTQGGV